jgi:hypothetical protein
MVATRDLKSTQETRMIDRLITSRAEFHTALREAFAEAATAGSRELWLADNDFADWPLGEREVVEHLSEWAASSRRLTLLANSFDEVARRHPRWVTWRRQWAHIVRCRVNTELEAGEVPSLLIASGTLTLRLSDSLHHRGRVSHDKADELRCRELIDAVLQRSEEAFPATSTGL